MIINNMLKMKLFINLFLCVILTGAFMLSSCKKKQCKALITVVDEQSNVVEGATVRLYYDDTNSTTGAIGNIDETQVTGITGQAEFTFDLEAILFIDAEKDTLTSNGIIKLVLGETAEETVVLK